jgi:hypothetical protein
MSTTDFPKDLTEIAIETEKLKSQPDWLDNTPVIDNKALGESADVGLENKPIDTVDGRKLERLADMFDTTTRAGAGGTKSNLVGLRPRGGKAAAEFLDDYTGVGRFKPEPKPYTENKPLEQTRTSEMAKAPRVVLYKRCMDCMERVHMDDCVPNIMPIPAPMFLDAETMGKWNAVGVYSGHVVCYLFCGECMREALAIMQGKAPLPPHISPLITFDNKGQRQDPITRFVKERGQRISEHVFAEIRNERNDPNSDCFYELNNG